MFRVPIAIHTYVCVYAYLGFPDRNLDPEQENSAFPSMFLLFFFSADIALVEVIWRKFS
jgi:hypothetical protein